MSFDSVKLRWSLFLFKRMTEVSNLYWGQRGRVTSLVTSFAFHTALSKVLLGSSKSSKTSPHIFYISLHTKPADS